MIKKPYIYRYKNILERNQSAQNPVIEASETESACLEKNSPQRSYPDQQGSADEQSDNTKEAVGKDTAGNSAFHGFEQIAPGIFQFRQPAYDKKEHKIPAELQSFLPQTEQTQPEKAGKTGFKRVDGLPGPYQHYSTPVFQFT